MAELARITRVKPGRVVTPIRAAARIERTSSGRYTLRLRTERDDQTGDTALDAPTCPVLKRGVTLVLALALGDGIDLVDEKATPSATPSEHAPLLPPSAPAPAPPPTAERRALGAPPTPTKSWRVAPWVAATASWGLLGEPAFGPQIGLAVGQAHWETLARIAAWPAHTAASVDGVDASLSAVIGAAGGCGRSALGAWSLAACAAIELGVIHAHSVGAYRDGSASAPYFAATPSLVLTAPLFGALKLRVESGLAIAFNPPEFAVRNFETVYTVGRFVPAFSVGLGFDPRGPR
jgi:hypothetical protein